MRFVPRSKMASQKENAVAVAPQQQQEEQKTTRRGRADITLLIGIEGERFQNAFVHFVGGSTVDFTDSNGIKYTVPTGSTVIRWHNRSA